jgi:hypothetical protein
MDFKNKIFQGMAEYWMIVAYLTIVFAAFMQYRRFVLAAHDITYTNYGFAVIEALILAKVVMVGDVARLGRGLEHKPLIYSTLYKTVVFTFFVGLFTIVENMIKGLWKGKGVMGGLADFFGKGNQGTDLPQIFVPQVKLGFRHFLFLNSGAPLALEDGN